MHCIILDIFVHLTCFHSNFFACIVLSLHKVSLILLALTALQELVLCFNSVSERVIFLP